MRRAIQQSDWRMGLVAAGAGVVLMAGVAGWGGSMIALSGADSASAAASYSTAKARLIGSPATSAPTPTSATTTPPTASPTPTPSPAADSSATPARRTTATSQPASVPPPPPLGAAPAPTAAPLPPNLDEADIVFVSPWPDSGNGQWYYRIGLLDFPADTVVEISGHDIYGNTQVASLVMTTAEGSSNPFTTGFSTNFAYGGTCDDAHPTTVTARGKGFSVTETAPRPLECDGGTTPNGPWPRPINPAPVPSPAAPPSTSGSGGT